MAPHRATAWRRIGAVAATAVLLASASDATQLWSTKRKFTALIFPDRSHADYFLVVSDLRINETLLNDGGERFFVLRAPDGTFQVPFEHVAEVEFTKYLGLVRGDVARFESRVVIPAQGVRRGTIDVRVLRGFVGRAAWHDLIVSRPDRGASLYRIVFVK